MSSRCTRAALSATPSARPSMAAITLGLGSLQAGGGRAAATAPGCCRHLSIFALSSRPSSSSRRQRAAPQLFSSSSTRLPLGTSTAASFSTTASCQGGRQRRDLRNWLNTQGKKFRPVRASVALERTLEGYADEEPPPVRPFPDNPFYKSKEVLSERSREFVYKLVAEEGESIKVVAARLGIDMRRVAAVVRLKHLEKQWLSSGKPLATPYANAMLSMLPQVDVLDQEKNVQLEPINEIHAHGYAAQQLFVPVSESRQFTRADAAKAFHTTLLPADKRMPIPELVTMERDVLTSKYSPDQGFYAFRETANAQNKAALLRDQAAAAAEHARTVRAETARFEFRVRDVNAEEVGKNGRSPRAVGWKYGVPFPDRKRGQVKIPTSV